MPSLKTTFAVAALTVSVLALPTEAAVRFNFIPEPGTSAQALGAFEAAGQRWASAISDDLTINIRVGFTSLGSDVLSHTDSSWTTQRYAKVGSHLVADAESGDDRRATRALPKQSVPMLINQTANHPNPGKRSLPYLDNDGDANNSVIRMHRANAKALGLIKKNAKGIDGTIVFGSDYAWDFDASDGIDANAFDFVGLSSHEIAHTLGFVSGVDTLEATIVAPMFDHQLAAVTPLDLFRYSSQSVAAKGSKKKGVNATPIDFTADGREKYFSIDGGKTTLAPFSAGALSDGHQASHWKSGAATGLLDPAFLLGQSLSYSAMDLRALDVIGWDLAGTSSLAQSSLPSVSLNALRFPEPGTLTFAGVGIAALARRRSRRQ